MSEHTSTGPAVIGPIDAPDLHVMSFNVRRAMEGPLTRRQDRWSTRAPAVSALLESERPALLGLQEVLPRVMPVVTEALGAHYRSVGRGRSRDGTGEGNPLLYDSARLQLRDAGQHALSDRPHDAGSTGWGNLIPRIFVWAEFVDRRTGARLLAVNTHLDHLSARSRTRSADSIGRFVAERAIPAVVTGDLNAGPASTEARTLLAEGALVDAWQIAETHLSPEWGSFPRYRRPRLGARRIDGIAVTRGVRVRAIGLNARTFAGRHPSDHLALQASVRVDAADEETAR